MSVKSSEPESLIIPALPPSASGRSSLQVFLTSMRAFALREMKNRYGRMRLGYVWAVVEPAATVAVMVLMHSVIRGHGAQLYGESPVVFFAFGGGGYFLFAGCQTAAQGACAGSKGLFNYRQIKPIDIILTRSLIESLMMLTVIGLFLGGWYWFGNTLVIDPLSLIFGLFSLICIGTALGLIFEVYGTVFPDLRRMFGLATRPLFFISGLFFTIKMIPTAYRPWLDWNPILQSIDLVRGAVLAGYQSPASFSYVWLCIVVMLFVGLAGYRRYLDRLI